MVAPMTEYELEAFGEAELGFGHEGEWEHGEGEAGEQFFGDVANWARRQWSAVQTPGSWQRRAALAAARSALPAAGGWVGEKVGGLVGPEGAPIGKMVGGALGSAGVSLLPDKEWEAELQGEWESAGEGEWEGEAELNPVRKVYLDAMLEHMAHEAVHAESEEEAVEGFLPLIPLLASKVLPLAAKVLPRIAGKVIPRLARAVTRVSPQLSRSVSNITRTLYRNPRTRQLVRVVPSIAQRTMTRLARQAAAGRAVTPQTAQRVLAQQAYQVLTRPQATMRALRRNAGMDRRYHGVTGIPASAVVSGGAGGMRQPLLAGSPGWRPGAMRSCCGCCRCAC